MKKVKKNKGFTLVEIIVVIALLATIMGIFSINMIKNMRSQKTEENENVSTQIISAAKVFVSVNPDKVKELYNGFGYVDIRVGELRDSGLLSEDLKNAETGVKISDEEKVRIKIDVGDNITVEYPVTEDMNSWELVADDIEVNYDKNTTSASWCSANQYMGLGSQNGSKLSLLNNETGAWYTGEYRKGDNITATSCNVNPQIAGTYTITYKFIDPSTHIERTKNRTVYVRISGNDVISFEAVINNNELIILNTPNKDVPIYIIETYKDGSKSGKIESTIEQMETAIKYSIEKFSTEKQGFFTAIVKPLKVNSDGSKPEPYEAPYRVAAHLTDILPEGPEDCGNTYVKYNDVIYRVYMVSKVEKTVNLIYTGSEIVEPYGQLGPCTNNSCCNNGRYTYNGLGQSDTGIPELVMDDILDRFYNQKNVNGPILQSQNTMFGAKKVALLSREDYTKIVNACGTPNNFTDTTFWLLDSESASGGPGNYNKGRNPAYAYDYAVDYTGKVIIAGASKNQTSEGDFGTSSVRTDKLVVRPTIKLFDPEITGGSGTRVDPYVIKS